MVQQVANILDTKEPCVGRCTRTVKNAIAVALNGLVAPFTEILVLMVGFSMPVVNDKRTEEGTTGIATNWNNLLCINLSINIFVLYEYIKRYFEINVFIYSIFRYS